MTELSALADAVVRDGYQLVGTHQSLLAKHSFNTIFRVESTPPQVLRVGGECRIHPPGIEDVEAQWLDLLADTEIVAPVNVRASNDSRWLSGIAPDDTERICTMFTWIEGHELRRELTVEGMMNAGQLLAHLHGHAESIRASVTIPTELRANQAIYFHDEDRVAKYGSIQGGLFTEATDRVQRWLDELWTEGDEPHLLHGDFGPHNVLNHHGDLRPIDFQDLRFGFAVQDLGLSIADLRRNDPHCVDPFLAGYRTVRPLPYMAPADMDLLAAARSLNIMNLGLHLPDSGIGRVFTTHADLVTQWMNGLDE